MAVEKVSIDKSSAVFYYVGDFGKSEAALREVVRELPCTANKVVPVFVSYGDGQYGIYLKFQPGNCYANKEPEVIVHTYVSLVQGWFLAHEKKNVPLP